MNQSVAIDRERWDLLLTSSPLVAISCCATWCGPCQVLRPVIDRLALEYKGRALVVTLDVDRDKELVKKMAIRSIPSFLIFQNGKLIDTLIGVLPYETFDRALGKYL